MSEEIRRFVAGEKITVTSTLAHAASGMDHTEGRSLLGNGYRLDLVSVPGATLLRREDGWLRVVGKTVEGGALEA